MPELSRLPAGSILDDRYRVGELLSVGGMGAVYSGSHTLLQKAVAIKVLRTDLPGSQLMVDRFHREAIAASAIGHENIVQVTDMGVTRDGTAYLVMELLHGRSLGDAIRAEAPFSVERTCRVATEILRGLGAAHQAGIVHRDLKPDNVFLSKKGDREIVKLLDFGVALLKRPDVPDTRLTFTGTVLGTPRYMSPEQARGEQDLTGAADLYACGVLMYEMLTGELPYFGTSYNIVIHEIISGERVPIESRRPDVPPEVAALMQRAMALAPEDRYATTDDMAAGLEPFIERTEASKLAHMQIPAAYAATAAAPKLPREPTPLPSAAPAHGRAPRRKGPSAPEGMLDEPAWAGGGKAPVGGDPSWSGSKPPRGAPRSKSGRFASEELEDRPYRSERGGKMVGIAVVLVLAGTIAVFMLVRRGGADDDTERAADAAVSASVSGRASIPAPPQPTVAGDAGSAGQARQDTPPPVEKPPEQEKPQPAKPREQTKPRESKPSKPPAREEKGRVTIEFLVVPTSARVTVDGKSVSGKRLTVKRGKKAIKVRIEAPGYEPRTVSVVPSTDREVVLQLIPKAEDPPPDREPPPREPPAEGSEE